MKQILTDFPEAKWHQYEPVNRDNARAGAIMAFGQDVHTTYDFSKADRILSLGSDFLNGHPENLRYARDYARRRGVDRDKTEMNRLYVIESTPTMTGANADHRFSVKPTRFAHAYGSLAMPSRVGRRSNGAHVTSMNRDELDRKRCSTSLIRDCKDLGSIRDRPSLLRATNNHQLFTRSRMR